MASPRDPLAVFGDKHIEAVAGEFDVEPDRLCTLTRRHQESVRDLPGVEDIVYEWRNQFHQDPLVHRDTEAYVLALRDHVWAEFADHLDLRDAHLAALRALHDTQARALAVDTARFDEADAVVLTRP